LRVAPVGDVDVEIRKQALDGSAQERRIVARHRSNHQQPRSLFDTVAREMLELAERLPQKDLLVDADLLAADLDAVDPKIGFAVRRRGTGEDLEARRHDRAHGVITEGIRGIVEPSGAQTGKPARTCEKRALHLIGVVEHPASFLPLNATDVARLCSADKGMLQRKAAVRHLRLTGHAAKPRPWRPFPTGPRADRSRISGWFGDLRSGTAVTSRSRRWRC